MDPFLLVAGLVVAWLVVAALLALAMGRAVAVARARDEHRPPRSDAARVSLARRTIVVLGRAAGARSR